MKKIIILALIVIAVLVIPPFFIGSTVESQFRDQITKANVNPAYQIVITDYQKGWFSSQGEVEVTFAFPSKTASPFPVKVTQNLQHGPILWQGESISYGLMDAVIKVKLPKEIQAVLADVASSNNNANNDANSDANSDTIKTTALDTQILSITARTSFDLSTESQLVLKAFAIEKDGTIVDVKSATGHFNITTDGQIDGALDWGGMSINEALGTAVNIGKVTMDTKQRLVSGQMFSPTALFNGHLNANLASYNMTSSYAAQKTALQALNLKATSDINDGLAKIAVVVTMKQLEAIQQNFKEIVYDMSFDSLDVEALKQINQIVADSKGDSPMMLTAKIQGALPGLLAKIPVIKINKMGMETQAGNINSNMTITIDKDLYNVNNPMTMMMAVKADAQGHAPEAFFTSLGMSAKIEQMLQQNFVVRDNENIQFEFSFKAGQALLNGQVMPLGGM
jgi:uncharacterized protein YdgA (DUF945 family)